MVKTSLINSAQSNVSLPNNNLITCSFRLDFLHFPLSQGNGCIDFTTFFVVSHVNMFRTWLLLTFHGNTGHFTYFPHMSEKIIFSLLGTGVEFWNENSGGWKAFVVRFRVSFCSLLLWKRDFLCYLYVWEGHTLGNVSICLLYIQWLMRKGSVLVDILCGGGKERSKGMSVFIALRSSFKINWNNFTVYNSQYKKTSLYLRVQHCTIQCHTSETKQCW